MDIKKEFLGVYNIYCSKIHRFGTDAVLLEYFSKPKTAKNACDLGTGCGIIPVLSVQDNPDLKILAVDIQPDAIALCEKTISENALCENIKPLLCDLKELPKDLNDKFDLVTINPPYKRAGAGKITGVAGIDIARNEIKCTLSDICKAAYKLLQPMGRFCICQRPERMADVIYEMKCNRIEPKIIRNVINKSGDKAQLVLIMGQKCGNSGINIERDLILKNSDGSDTDEVSEIYKIIRNREV